MASALVLPKATVQTFQPYLKDTQFYRPGYLQGDQGEAIIYLSSGSQASAVLTTQDEECMVVMKDFNRKPGFSKPFTLLRQILGMTASEFLSRPTNGLPCRNAINFQNTPDTAITHAQAINFMIDEKYPCVGSLYRADQPSELSILPDDLAVRDAINFLIRKASKV